MILLFDCLVQLLPSRARAWYTDRLLRHVCQLHKRNQLLGWLLECTDDNHEYTEGYRNHLLRRLAELAADIASAEAQLARLEDAHD